MKHIIISCFLTLLLAGCGGGDTPPAGQTAGTTVDASTSASTSIDLGSATKVVKKTCSNGATDWPHCSACPSGTVMYGGSCIVQEQPPQPSPTCTNGATDYPTCAACPSGQSLVNGTCTVTSTPTPTPTPTTPGPAGQDAIQWTMTFDDEFSGSSLDTTKWNDHIWYETPDSVINYGTSNGFLNIWPESNFVDRNVDTDGKFSQLYGYFEIEAKLPYGKGPWPAFWLYAHPCDSGNDCRKEVDIFEAYSGGGVSSWWSDANLHPNNFGVTLHEANADYSYNYIPYATKMRDFEPYNSSPIDLSAAYHKYGVKWDQTGMTFYFDGQQLGPKFDDTTGYYNTPMYIILSLAFGSASGTPDSTTPLGIGNSLSVNYVRVWKAK